MTEAEKKISVATRYCNSNIVFTNNNNVIVLPRPYAYATDLFSVALSDPYRPRLESREFRRRSRVWPQSGDGSATRR